MSVWRGREGKREGEREREREMEREGERERGRERERERVQWINGVSDGALDRNGNGVD